MSGKERKEAMKKRGKRTFTLFLPWGRKTIRTRRFEFWILKEERGNRIPKERKTINFFFFLRQRSSYGRLKGAWNREGEREKRERGGDWEKPVNDMKPAEICQLVADSWITAKPFTQESLRSMVHYCYHSRSLLFPSRCGGCPNRKMLGWCKYKSRPFRLCGFQNCYYLFFRPD